MAEKMAILAKDNESPPTLYLRDEQIKKYMSEDFDNLKIGETKEVTVTLKVTGLSERKEFDYDEKGNRTDKLKIHKNIDLEFVGKEAKTESNIDKALKNLGRTGPKV